MHFILEKDMFYTLNNVKYNKRNSLLQKPKHFWFYTQKSENFIKTH